MSKGGRWVKGQWVEDKPIDIKNAIEGMMELVWLTKAFSYNNGAPKARKDSVRLGGTRKGAVHKVNPTFRSRNHLSVSPAQYRHFHLGKRK